MRLIMSAIVAVLLPVSLLTGAAGPAVAADSVKMVLAMTQPAESTAGKAHQLFADLAKKYSNGRIDAQVFPGGQLGQFPQMAAGVKAGTIHAFYIQPDALGQRAEVATANSWPFMFDTPEQSVKAWRGPAGQAVIKAVESETGYRMVAPGWNGPRHILTNRVVTRLADLKGAKVRVPGTAVYVNQAKLLGLSPTPIAAGEIYTAMQQRVIDAAELTITDADGFKLQEVSKTVVLTGHVTSPKIWIFWGKWLDGLEPAVRDAVMRAADEASEWFGAQAKKNDEQLFEAFRKAGVKFVEPGLSRDELRKLVEPLKQLQPKLAPWGDQLAAGGR